MKKNSTKGYFVLGILFTMVSVFAFAVPTAQTATFWIAYAFTAVALAAQIPVWKVTLGRDDKLKRKFLSYPVLHIGIVYLVVQLAAFVVFLLVPTAPAWISAVVCAVIAGIAAICMIAVDTGRNAIERVETKVQAKVFYIKSLQADVELLANQEPDQATRAALAQLAEKIRFSDPMSYEQLADVETQIAVKVSELKAAANKDKIITEIHSLLDERNKKCKILK